MKILFLNTSNRGGGAERFTEDLATSLPGSTIVYGHSSKKGTASLKNGETSFVDKAVQKFFGKRSFRHLLGIHDQFHGTYNKLRNTWEYQEAEIVHINNIHGGWFDIDALAKIDGDKKVVWTLHDMWAMTGGEAYVFNNDGYKEGLAKTPYLDHYPLNSPWFDFRQWNMNRKERIYTQLENTVFVPVSKWLEDCLKSAYVFNDKMFVHTIKNGVDTKIFKRAESLNRERKRILFFNSNSPFKGGDLGLRVLSTIDEEHEIWIVGNHPGNSIREFNYVGNRIEDRKELAALYNSVDVLLFPSLAENMPLTVLEAMACGVVAVGTPVGGIPEIIRDGETGFLSKTTHYEDVLKKLRICLGSDLAVVGRAAEEFVLKYHNHESMIDQYVQLYESLLDR